MRRGGRVSGACRLLLVTGNRHKFEEASGILEPYGVKLEQAPLGKVEIQSGDLATIALYAARKAYLRLRRPLIVDDTGLFIKHLNGFPGVYSSYVYKTIGYWGILRLLDGVRDRRACFITVVAAIVPPFELVFRGETCGWITEEPAGSQGFGFDPVFIPDGHDKTYAEMTLAEKNMVSHRGKAFSLLGEYLSGHPTLCRRANAYSPDKT